MENNNHSQGALRDDSLKGKTIVITGGGTGLGRAMGTYFLKLGANLVITSRKLDVLQETAKELEAETGGRSEEHTSELQSLMRISYAVFCLKKKKYTQIKTH